MAEDIWEFAKLAVILTAVLTLAGVVYTVFAWVFLAIALRASDCTCPINWMIPTGVGIAMVIWETIEELWKRRKEW